MDGTPHAGPDAFGDRHQARERALSLLYEAEQKQVPVAEVITDLPVAPDGYARSLALGVDDRRTELDARIAAASQNWALERMPLVDLTILRLGTYELTHRPDVPTPVVIDEAVELAKAYCGDSSPGFVNGILARLAADRPG